MSAWTLEFIARMVAFRCDHCYAKPGESCKRSDGQPCLPHASRCNKAKDAEEAS